MRTVFCHKLDRSTLQRRDVTNRQVGRALVIHLGIKNRGQRCSVTSGHHSMCKLTIPPPFSLAPLYCTVESCYANGTNTAR